MTKEESHTVINNPLRIREELAEIRSDMEGLSKNAVICNEENFNKRAEASDFLEFHIIDRLDSLRPKTAKATALKDRAEKLKTQLDEIDNKLFKKIRAGIRAGQYSGAYFKNLVSKYFDLNAADKRDEPDYDNLDIFINRLLTAEPPPRETRKLEPEMVFYQKTPARVIFELAEKVNFGIDDVFFDIGSGLGQAVMLVNLATGIKAVGVEFEPAFCDYARRAATELDLNRVTFINTDARDADYSKGTVFFMYTPFKGEILKDVLELLRKEALNRKISIITYGPCTAAVVLQRWLKPDRTVIGNIYEAAVFTAAP